MNEDDLFAHFESELNIDETELNIVDVSTLTTVDLADKIKTIERQLFDMREAIIPRTQKARDLHSFRNACQIEWKKRFNER